MSMLDAASKADQWQDAGAFLRQQAAAEQDQRPVRRGPLLAVIEYLARELTVAGDRAAPLTADAKPEAFKEFTAAVCNCTYLDPLTLSPMSLSTTCSHVLMFSLFLSLSILFVDLRTFASKISCFDDLRRYLERIPASSAQELSDNIVATITEVVASMEVSVDILSIACMAWQCIYLY
eukprot:TRINITY_DN5911_c0_g1_i7.p2 TRINITY_DN5911_c0_g1~~TRINITY_DN5911_c0_g1_i7.p2  ORF type:complete len:178 (-),score=26.22 TRINITY_DN5911_c0_g1_i7:24-557(-)